MNEDARNLGLSLATIAILATGLMVIAALLLWPLDRLGLLAVLARGLAGVFAASLAVMAAGMLFVRLSRRDPTDSHSSLFDGWVIVHVVAGAGIMVWWSLGIARPVDAAVADLAWWQAGLVYLLGLAATVVAENVAGEFFSGALYRIVNPIVAQATYIASAVGLYFGW